MAKASRRDTADGTVRGGVLVDPTVNVVATVHASEKLTKEKVRRVELLLKRNDRAMKREISHVKEIAELRADHQRREDHAESQRIDSIRQVDREEVAKTAASAQTAIATLAATTNTMAETLRTQVATTASAAETRNAAQNTDFNKRLSALELSSSEGKGKMGVVDPQMAEFMTEMRAMMRIQATGAGKSEGGKDMWKYVAGGFAFLYLLLQIYTTVIKPQPVTYAPPPATATSGRP